LGVSLRFDAFIVSQMQKKEKCFWKKILQGGIFGGKSPFFAIKFDEKSKK